MNRISAATNHEILNHLNFEVVHYDYQWSESDEEQDQFILSIFMFPMISKLQKMAIECLEPISKSVWILEISHNCQVNDM